MEQKLLTTKFPEVNQVMIQKKLLMNKIKSFGLFVTLLLVSQAEAGWSAKVNDNEYGKTQYPIVLTGGAILNFDKLGPIDYFYQIPKALQKVGATIFVATVSGSHTPEVRGEQLYSQIEDILAITGKDKVNIITGSVGGVTGRYVAAVYPEKVASLTTIDGGHGGAPLADLVVNIEEQSSIIGDLIYKLGDGVTGLLALLTGDTDLPIDTKALAYAHTKEGAAEFTNKYPEGMPAKPCGEGNEVEENGVHYYSMSGATPITNLLDPADYICGIGGLLFFPKEPSDGFIGACSGHLGKVIRDDYRMNHLDIFNQLLGIRGCYANPITMYKQHANRLKNLGL